MAYIAKWKMPNGTTYDIKAATCSGNSATATNADMIDNYHANALCKSIVTDTLSFNSLITNYNSALGMIHTSEATPDGSSGWYHYFQANYNNSTGGGGSGSNFWVTQLANAAGSTNLYIRSRSGGNTSSTNWSSWQRFLNSANYTDYTVTKTGSGASGTWSINISGNAASASSIAWGNISGKPSTYTPTSHEHDYIVAKGNYTFDSSTLPCSFNYGISAGFVNSNSGFGSYGTVLTVRTYSAGGGTLQLYAPYSATYGGTRLKARFGNYASSSGNSWTTLQDIAWWDHVMQVYNTSWIGNSSGVTMNDLADQGVAYGMIYNSTDNPRGSHWMHTITMGWGKTRSSWVGQISLDTDSANLYFRANGNSAITGVGWYRVWRNGDAVTSAVWNDYAEYREISTEEPGRCVYEIGDDTLRPTDARLMKGCSIISDTWGFAQGKTERAQTPIAVSGRVLAYPLEDRETFRSHIGDAVCSGPNGTVSIMSEDEVLKNPLAIIGTISTVPDYTEWGGGENADRDPVQVNGRVWIRIK